MTTSNKKSNQNQMQEMVQSIKEEILMGKRQAGEYLPSEKTLASQFQMSNLTVRRGLEQLVSENLIEKIPRVGNRIKDTLDGEVVTVQFAFHTSLITEAVIERLIQDFHMKHANIRIQTLMISSNNYLQMTKDLMDRGTIDVLTVNYSNFRDFVIHDCVDYFESLEPSAEIYSFLPEQFKSGDELKVQPFIFSPLVLCYNKQHFKEMDIGEPDSSWSWKKLFEIADRLADDQERIGFYCNISSLNRWIVFFIQAGVQFRRDEHGKITTFGSGMMEALQQVREVFSRINLNPMLLSRGPETAEELFYEGKISMLMTTYLGLNHFQFENLEFDIAPLPYLRQPVTTLQTIGLSMYSRSKVKESAKLFIEYLTSQEAQLTIRKNTYSIPAHKLAAEYSDQDHMYRPARFGLYREIIPSFRLYTDLRMTETELKQFSKAVWLYWSGLEQEDVLLTRLQSL